MTRSIIPIFVVIWAPTDASLLGNFGKRFHYVANLTIVLQVDVGVGSNWAEAH